MNALQKIQAAQKAAALIIASFTQATANQPDVVTARREAILAELEGMKTAEKIDKLIGMVITLENPKPEHKVKTEDVAKALLTNPDCACLTYGDIAEMIVKHGLGEKTSTASISSYASKKKNDWPIVERERLKFNAADLMEAAAHVPDAAPEQVAVGQ